ncbi:MAG: DUF6428 family protein [Rhodospirillales bacterium]
MNLSNLLSHLDGVADDASLVFATQHGPIGGGYHVTEFKRSDITGIDCGGHVSTWTEASMQLLDDAGEQHMRIAKFKGILGKTLATVERLGDAPLRVEFANGNAGLGLYHVIDINFADDRVLVSLGDEGAACKPALRNGGKEGASSCCSGVARAGACCT